MVRSFILHSNSNPFQPSVGFHIETSPLFCSAKQMTGFYMKCNIGLKWVKEGLRKLFFDNICLIDVSETLFQ